MFKSIALIFAVLAVTVAPAVARTYYGPDVTMGRGTAWTIVQTDANNHPTAFGLQFTADAITGLPALVNTRDPDLDWPYYLSFPANAPATGFDHINIDWHPMGHPPKVYEVPHFDFHFYTISVPSQLAIHFPDTAANSMRGIVMPASALMPHGFVVPPGTAVNEMGLHAIPVNAPELHGGRFTDTLIYGYDAHGALVFLEPMITVSYLLSHPHVSSAIPAPAAYSSPGYYPQRCSISYDPKQKLFTILYSGLRPWHVGQLATR